MIQLTRLNGQEFILNAELIKFVEQTPDTVVTLREGERIIVKEPIEEVVKRTVEYHRSLRWLPSERSLPSSSS
ncbi:flagellar FlbD family protein [bacterium]|nr:flagellar FlbD family protein [bacterium]